VKVIDLLLRPIICAWQKISSQKNPSLQPQDFQKIKKILILRTAYTGDVVMTLPVLIPLRNAFPNAEICFLTSHSAVPVLEHHPAAVQVIQYDAFWFYVQPKLIAFKKYQEVIKRIRQERFDLVFDFRGDIRDIFFLAYRSKAKYRFSYGSGGGAYWLTQVIPLREIKHRVQFHLDILRELKILEESSLRPVLDDNPKIYLTVAEKQNALNRLQSLGVNLEKDVLIGIHPGARMALKRWPIDRYAALIDRLLEANLGIVIYFTEPENQSNGVTEKILRHTDTAKHRFMVLSDLTLRELAAVLSYCKIFIGNDSAPMHLAAAVGTKCVALFGPSKSNETGPYGSEHIVIEKPYPCRQTCDEATCRYTIEQDCMKAITVDEVFQAVAKNIRT
jgi:lipopolysaccharide heptosyltransferase II